MMRISTLALAMPLVLGCAIPFTQQTRNVEKSGFLGDDSELTRGGSGEALWVWVDPEADFRGYKRIALDPVTVWTRDETGLEGVPTAQVIELVNHLDRAMRSALGQDWELVDRASPTTLRVRVALTEARASRPLANAVSTLAAPLTRTARLATGARVFAGRAAIEVELLDSLTNRRLAAAIDRREEGLGLRDVGDSWSGVRLAFEDWAERLRAWLTTEMERR